MNNSHSSPTDLATASEIFERSAEMAALVQGVLSNRKSMLLFGEAGAGKTRLLRTIVAAHPNIAYVTVTSSARELLLGILAEMHPIGSGAAVVTRVKGASLIGLRRMVETKLETHKWTLILDQLQSPSNAMSHLVKELNYYERTPILFAGRSPHMEDIGGLRSLCFNRESRVELKPLAPPLALEFAHRHAELSHLTADNLDQALKSISEMSRGYPGRILRMLRMASEERYRHDGYIKFHILYVDYSMNGGSTDRGPKGTTRFRDDG